MAAGPQTHPGAPTGTEVDADTRTLRRALGSFATGITVVTGRRPDGVPYGLTASSFQSLSLDPPLILYSSQRGAASLDSLAARPASFGSCRLPPLPVQCHAPGRDAVCSRNPPLK